MHDETIAIHGGYTPDGTRAVAVPIYQTVAHDFIDAAHAGAVLDLETPGFHYNRLNNPTLDVLEQRIAALEGGTAALVVRQAWPPSATRSSRWPVPARTS